MYRYILAAIVALGASFALAQQVSLPPPAGSLLNLCVYNATPKTITDGNAGYLQCDPSGNLSIAQGFAQPLYTTVTVANSSHTSGQCIGATASLSVTNNNGQSGYLLNASVSATTAITPTLILYFFNSNPTGSTCADAGTFSLATADISKLISPPCTMSLAAPAAVGTPTFGECLFTPPHAFIAGGATNSGVKTIYYQIVTSTTVTPAANGLVLSAGVSLN
jgi:hypothetical protein